MNGTRRDVALAVAGVVALLGILVPLPSADARAPDISTASIPDPVLPPAEFSVVAEEALVSMDDGVSLALTVVRPSLYGQEPAPGRFPVVVAMTPYGRNGVCGCIAPATFAERGIVGAVVDVRGTGGSGGDLSENYFSPREARDSATVIDWLGQQEWSTGRVGMAGGSYVGITQYLAAGQQPEHLAAIVPMLAISDLYRDGFAHGGIPNLLFDLQYIAVQGAPGYVGTNTDPFLLEQSVTAKLGQSAPGEIAFDYLARPFDDPFYRDRSPIATVDRVTVPVLTIGGWRDGLLRGQTEMHQALRTRPGVETRLHMDPCTHKGCGAPFAPLTDPGGRMDLLALVFEFLDRHLRDADTPERSEVEYHLQGRGAYLTADAWPPSDAQLTRLELAGEGLLAPAERVGAQAAAGVPVGAQPAQDAATVSYVTNPAAGFSAAFSHYGTVGLTPYVPVDQRLEGPHGVTFRTAPLDEPMAIVGPVALHLVASSTASDTDWHAKLADVAPDGTESTITEGALRASHREVDPASDLPARPYHTHVNPQPIDPDTWVAYDIEIWPTAYELRAGHQLQLRLTSTDLPTHLPGWIRFDADDPTATQLHLHDPAVNTVRLHASHLVLPVLGEAGDDAADPAEPDHPGGPPVDDGPRMPDTGWTAGATLLGLAATLATSRRRRSAPEEEPC